MNAPNANNSPASSPRTLALIRLALLFGVLIFGIIAWFLTRNGGLGKLELPVLVRFRLVLAIVFGAIAVSLFFLRRRWKTKNTYQGKAVTSLIGWAASEAGALAGGTYFIVTGNALYYLIGLVLMLIAEFAVLPVPKLDD